MTGAANGAGADAAVCERLADFLADHRSDGVPPEVLHEAKRSIMNLLGASLAAAGDETVALFDDWAGTRRPVGPAAHVLWRGSVRSPDDAAFVNAVAMHVLDYDETYVPTLTHPGTPAIAAGFATAEAVGASGRDFLLAVALGTQIALGVSRMLAPTHVEGRGFHISATTGTAGAAAASSLLRGLDRAQTTNALCIALAGAAGLKVMIGSTAKSFGLGNAARTGVAAADLAQRGATGTAQAIEGNMGVLQAMSDEPVEKLGAIVDDLARDWPALRVNYKPMPTGESMMAPLECIFDIRARAGNGGSAEVTGMELTVCPYTEDHVRRYPSRFIPGATAAEYRPRTRTEARFDMGYTLAAAWRAGSFSESLLAPEAIADEETLALRERIVTVADPDLRMDQARLTVTFADGRREEAWVEGNKGSAANPFDDPDFEAKLLREGAGRLAEVHLRRVIDALWTLDEAPGVAPFVDLLRLDRS